MSGFPVRPTLDSFGPIPQNRRPTRNPARELDAGIGGLMFWQLSGLGLLSHLAWVLCTPDDGGDLEVSAHAEAWSPDGGLPGPELTRTAAGIYTLEYEDEYADKDGVMRPLNLLFGIGAPQVLSTGGGALIVTLVPLSPSSMQATILRSGTLTHEDRAFAALIW